MEGVTTGEDINKAVENKTGDAIMGMAQDLFKRLDINVPEIPICYIHKKRFAGQFFEYTTQDRQVVKICIPCVVKSVDRFILGR